jgi:ankyrin repeat protein
MAYEGNIRKIKSIIDYGTRIDARDVAGSTALHYAILGDQFEAFELLLRSGANMHLQNLYGTSAVHLAASWNRTNMVKTMLASGRVNVNAASKFDGRTMLHAAAANCNLELIQLLVHQGADVNHKAVEVTHKGVVLPSRTALKEAISLSAMESVDLLLQFGADPKL